MLDAIKAPLQTQWQASSLGVRWRALPARDRTALLGLGLFLPSQRARLASAVIIGITILKVFLIDMSNLTGAWRAFSFIGLGLVLVAIGWLYQRILFKQTKTPPGQPAA